MSKEILIAEDDLTLGRVLQETLRDAGFSTQFVENGAEAISLVSAQNVSLVVTDVKMPEKGGLDVLRWCKQNRPSLPVILMTGISELMEVLEANQVGATGLILKPFHDETFLKKIEDALKYPAANEEPKVGARQWRDNEFCRVPINEFISGKKLPFGIYIRIAESKFIKVAHSGDDLDPSKVESYRSKGVSHLYLTHDDFKKYLDQTLILTRNMSSLPALAKEKKLHLLKHTEEMLMQRIYVEGMDSTVYGTAKNFVMAAMESLCERHDLLSLLHMLNQHTDFLYAHSLGVALYSVLICQALNWRANPTSYTVMLAGLFHDIGKKEIQAELLETPRIMLNQRQRVLVESHASRGGEILSAIPNIPQEIVQVALQHHEDMVGYGYPNHLKGQQVSPLSRLTSVADVFCRYTIKNPDHPEPLSAPNAMAQLDHHQRERLDRQFVEALRKAIRSP